MPARPSLLACWPQNDRMTMAKISDLFGQKLAVLNIGLSSMADSVREQGVAVTEIDWQPPKDGVPRLKTTKTGISIEDANQEVANRIKRGQAFLVGMGIARQTIPGMHDHMSLHAGPPIEWYRMCGPTRGAIMGA